MTVGIGIVTFRRPERYRRCVDSVWRHLRGVVDAIAGVHDGPDPGGYGSAGDNLRPVFLAENQGVAAAKNWCLRTLSGCDWVFLCEDDMVIDSPDAVTSYIAAAEASEVWSGGRGQRHLNFHAHGPANRVPMATHGPVTLWPNVVGSWSLYHRSDLETVGLMDEAMVNAFEHVEHTARLMRAGACHRWPGVADATGSEYWLHEQPGAIEDTSIPTAGRFEQQRAAILHWREKDEASLRMIFPRETPWEKEPVPA